MVQGRVRSLAPLAAWYSAAERLLMEASAKGAHRAPQTDPGPLAARQSTSETSLPSRRMQASGSGTSDEAAGFDGALRAIGKVVSSPTDPDVWNDATSVALKWLLRRTAVDDGALGEDSGTGHWYCPRGCKEVKPTWGEPAEELGFEDFQRVAAFLLRLFGFVTKDDVQKWRDGWRRAITGCVDCAIGHTKAEEILVNESVRSLPLCASSP